MDKQNNEETPFFAETFSSLTSAELVNRVKEKLSDFRFQHCVRTSNTAVELARLNGVDLKQAAIAGFLHDYAKEVSVDSYQKTIEKQGFDLDLLNWNRGIWHGMVGAYFVEEELHVHNVEILNAIRRHTTGDPQMTNLDKVVFMADYIEPGRDFPGVADARRITLSNLNAGVQYQLQHTLIHLISAGLPVYPLTLATYNKLGTRNL